MRAVSLEAGLSPGYYQGMINGGQDPKIGTLLEISKVLNVTLSWLLFGYQLTPEQERLLQVYAGLPPKAQEALVASAEAMLPQKPDA